MASVNDVSIGMSRTSTPPLRAKASEAPRSPSMHVPGPLSPKYQASTSATASTSQVRAGANQAAGGEGGDMDIAPREIPRRALWVSGTVPFFLLIAALASSYFIYKDARESDSVRELDGNGFIGALILCFAVNLMKRFFDILEAIRMSRGLAKDEDDADDAESRWSPEALKDAEPWRRNLARCLCGYLRWKHVWNVSLTMTIYLLFAISALVFCQRILVTRKITSIYAALFFIAAYIIFALLEGVYYVWLETTRLHEATQGMIFICTYCTAIMIAAIVASIT